MTGGTNSAISHRDLCVVFTVEPAPESSCPLGALDRQIEEIRKQLAGNECHTDECACLSEQEYTEVVHSMSDIDAACPCTVFGKFSCVPELVDIVDGRMLIETDLSDHERLSDLVKSLKEVSDSLRLRQLKRLDTEDDRRSENHDTLAEEQ